MRSRFDGELGAISIAAVAEKLSDEVKRRVKHFV